jgi:solute carrier family 30 (zinc transporter), member 1
MKKKRGKVSDGAPLEDKDGLQERLLVHTGLHDLADLPDLEEGAAGGHGHGHGGAGAGARGDKQGGEHENDQAWTRRKDLHGDLGTGWRLRAAAQKSSRKFSLMLFLSGSYFLAEMVVGVMSGSLAVLADAFHMLTDIAALTCGYYVAQLSFRERTQEMSFGWKRAEVVGALCNACFLIAICTTIVLDAVEKLTGIRGTDGANLVANANEIIVLGCVGLAINLGGMCIFGGHGHSHGGGGHSHGGGGHTHGAGHSHAQPQAHGHEHGHEHGGHEHGHEHGGGGECGGGHSHEQPQAHGHEHGHERNGGHSHGGNLQREEAQSHTHGHAHDASVGSVASSGNAHRGKEKQNLNELSMYLHVLGDAIGSAFVVANACIVKYGTQWGDKRLLADPIASLIMCFIILIQAVPLVRDTALILMESAPTDFSSDRVRSLIGVLEDLPEVMNVHDFHLWQLDSSTFICTAHVVLQTESVLEVNRTVDKIKKILHRNNIHSSTIQTEIHSAGCVLCERSVDGTCEAPLLIYQQSACSDFVCDDGECLAKSTSVPSTEPRSPQACC